MRSLRDKYLRVCPRSGKITGLTSPRGIALVLAPLLGLLALGWIVFRVATKPSRITYPCVRAAMPLASGLIGYVLSVAASVGLWAVARKRQTVPAMVFTASLACLGLFLSYTLVHDPAVAVERQLPTLTLNANEPIGTAVGIYPGRVVWVHRPEATRDACSPASVGHEWYRPENYDQSVIDTMVSTAIQRLTGTRSDAAAWEAIFRFHNSARGKGAVGYAPGEKILVKTNATSSWGGQFNTSDLSAKAEVFYYAVSETSPGVVLSMLRQLVHGAGVAQGDIYVGDPMKHIYKHCYDLWHGEFPDVHYLDTDGYANLGRELAVKSTTAKVQYSDRGAVLKSGGTTGTPITEDLLYEIFDTAEYLLNVPMLKGHKRAGVTMFAKNHFGSHTRSSATHVHGGLVTPNEYPNSPYRMEYGLYRVQVDLMGHELLGRKNLLYLMDALWATDWELDIPVKWQMAPFHDDWMSSVFASFDPVAIESVGYDFLRSEFTEARGAGTYPQMPAVDDYLHQAADSTTWAAGISYDPENDGTVLSSLGTHEHWNDSLQMQYSRNLGPGNGIELVRAGAPPGEWPPETKSITQANTNMNFTICKATVDFSTLPLGGGNVTITRHEQLPDGPPAFPTPPASASYVPLWFEITSTMPQHSFVAQVTLDVNGITGFGPNTRLLIHLSGASTWVPMPGTYNAGSHTFAFTTRHFSEFAFANPSGNAFELYIATAPDDTLANVVFPNTAWGPGTSYEPHDWSWTGLQPVTVYIAPQPGSVFSVCNLIVEWDSTVMHLSDVDWGSAGSPNGLFGSGHIYPVSALHEQLGTAGRVTLDCSRLDDTNFNTADGDHIAALTFTLLRPGYSPLSVVGCDVRASVPDQAPAGVFITPHIGQVKAYLGDIAGSGSESTGDGKIDFEDLVLWSYSYWSGVPGYEPGMQHYMVKYDIGPTHNRLMTSLPVVDGAINFEDLVMFSLAYGESNAFSLPKPVVAVDQEMTLTAGAPIVSSGETRIPVMLSGEVQDVRALSVTATGKFGKFIGVDKGALLQGYTTPVIVMTNSLNGRLQVDLAVAGLSAKTLASQGELLVLRFGGTASVAVSRAEARSSANAPLAINVRGLQSETPAVFALEQNYPNPFNPSTTIQYALPGSSFVRLCVFNSLGEKVAELVNGNAEAGYHEVKFEAGKLASGVYFYRLQAGDFVQTRKLLVLR